MCDTIAKIHPERGVFFAKNSDRHPKEVQLLERVSGSLDSPLEPTLEKYSRQFATLKRAHSGLQHPYRALISRPAWIWGAEMGVNEHGLSIGNEAVFTKVKPKADGLLGMDILRLALHNSATAAEGVDLILSLLKQWGQGGDGSFVGTLTYSNSFIIADRSELFVLETAGTHWAVKKIAEHGSISNAYSLASDFDRSDAKSSGGDFARRWADRLMEFFSKGRVRQATTATMLKTAEPSWMGMRDILLYNRGSAAKMDRSMASIAIDARFPKPTRTTASMVVEYPRDQVIVWCCPAPLPLYHPFVPMLVNGKSDPQAYPHALQRQKLTNALLKASPEEREDAFRSARKLEARFEARVRPLVESGEAEKFTGAITRCQNEAESRERELAKALSLR